MTLHFSVENAKLILPDDFNKPLVQGIFPDDLQELVFGKLFNQPLDQGVLPVGLQTLTLGDEFNQPVIPGVLPEVLQTLTFGRKFNQPIGLGVLPEVLQTLTFGRKFNQPIGPGVLPEVLQTLTLGDEFNQHVIPGVLPEGLQSLTFGGVYQTIDKGVLPSGLKTLTFGFYYDKPIGQGVLPPNLKTLIFGNNFNQPLAPGDLPDSLEILDFGDGYTQEIKPGVLPPSLKTLIFGYISDEPRQMNIFPAGLKDLTLGYFFDQPIVQGMFPSSLEILSFGGAFNQEIEKDTLPPSLKTIQFGFEFNKELVFSLLPPTLENISLEHFYKYKIDVSKFPPSLQSFTMKSVEQLSWIRTLSGIETLDEEQLKTRVREFYTSGFPVPVEPHSDTQLYIDKERMEKIRIFSIDRKMHVNYIRKNPDKRVAKLVNEWIYGDYSNFNKAISDFNQGIPINVDLYEFTERIGINSFDKSYEILRNAIMNAPVVSHDIFAWRGVRMGDEICNSLIPGQLVGFSRFMACSVAQEVSCNFSSDGELLLLELPPGCPLLNLTGLKRSEPEFLLPDRCCFEMVNRIPNNWCSKSDCKYIIHLRLIGVYTKNRKNMELALGPFSDLSGMTVW